MTTRLLSCKAVYLYVLCAGRPSSFLTECRLGKAPGWPTGFYQTNDHARLWVVVLPELPR